MNLQFAITLCIEIIFWSLVIVMMTDFVNGLFDLWWSKTLAPVSVNAPQLNTETEQITANKPQFEEIPDPWELPTKTQNKTSETESIVLPFPTLLPPAKKVQTKRKRTTTKSTATKPKSAKGKSPQTTSKSRKKAS